MDKGSHVNRENDPILHAATGWVLELQNPDVGPERIAAWERWLAEDPRHVQAFDKVAAMWSSAAELRRVPLPSEGELADDDYDGTLSVSAWRMRAAPLARPRVDTASVREATRMREPAVSGDKASLHGGWSIVAIAAGLCALAVLWGAGGNVFVVPGFGLFQRVSTEAGETRRLSLEDGTAVSVSGDSRLWIRMLPDERIVSLSAGEAYFDVAKDPNRPFIVRAGDTKVTAVGTAFNVRHAGGRVVVAVSEGIVDVVQPVAEPASATVEQAVITTARRLSAGQEVRVERAKPLPLPIAVEMQAVGGWRDGRLQYLDEPLRNIVADIRRYSAREMVIVDPALGDLRITGTVFENNLDAWLEGLESMFPLQVERGAGDQIRLLPISEAGPSTTPSGH